jgi:8-oxo-dGTP pyrophosphatase MutT (NUDIX family)
VTDEDARHSVSVAGVVIDEDGCTLVAQRRDNGHGEPPGGILERDESIADGLVREVREETGLIVEPIALTGVYKNTSQGIVTLVFRCRVKSNPGGVISQEAFSAYEVLADLARSVGLDATFEVVPPPGLVHLNRPNLVVLTNPRLLPFLSQILEADPHLRYLHDDDGGTCSTGQQIPSTALP